MDGDVPVSLALLVIGNGRLDYLRQAVDSLEVEADHYLMVDDSGDREVARTLDREYPDFEIAHHPTNLGMAAAVQRGWKMALAWDATHVLHWEEDFTQQKPLPITEAIGILDAQRDISQILFQRQPLTPAEHEAGSVVGAMGPVYLGVWALQRHIFSLNPCIIPRRTLELGWPAGNEREMTERILDRGWSMGVWLEGPLVHHIGDSRAKNWQL